jgi:2-hydroxychromene-2-carboxylate isomerase
MLQGCPSARRGSLAAIGMLWAKRQGKRQVRAYHDRVFERIWRRELDIEDAEAIAAVLSEVNADRTGFRGFLASAGRIELDTIRHSAESAGVSPISGKSSRLLLEMTLFGWRRLAKPENHVADAYRRSVRDYIEGLERGWSIRRLTLRD